MAIRIIRTGNDPVLRQISKPVQAITPAIEKLLDDMADTMYHAEGVGLAAVQIGVLKRVIVMDVGDGLIELINPEITEKSGSQVDSEGCLSLPGIRGPVERALHVVVRGLNRKGEPVEIRASELLARCVQHEVDHLNGILFIDYVRPEDLVYVNEKERTAGQARTERPGTAAAMLARRRQPGGSEPADPSLVTGSLPSAPNRRAGGP
ncbi:MAG: peptide deformylase [Alicyclobacillaceae bacterium]|nr:peptide deformylase [Alicyclobacillaceae bacterium]